MQCTLNFHPPSISDVTAQKNEILFHDMGKQTRILSLGNVAEIIMTNLNSLLQSLVEMNQ